MGMLNESNPTLPAKYDQSTLMWSVDDSSSERYKTGADKTHTKLLSCIRESAGKEPH